MRYEGNIYSPHIAGDDYVLQCTIGCSHNQCTFCDMYKDKKYRIRQLNEILEDIDLAKECYGDIEKVFLADGDALSMSAVDLIKILDYLYHSFPSLTYVGIYASAVNIQRKTRTELLELQKHGLVEVHLGVESGDDEILRAIRKGANRAEIMEAGRKIKQAGIQLFVTVILGLAGKMPKAWQHAQNTALICNEMQPDYIGILTILISPGTELYENYQKGEFDIPDDMDILEEMRLMIEGMELESSGITSIHPSNCIYLEGILNNDKDKLLQTLTQIIDGKDLAALHPREIERV